MALVHRSCKIRIYPTADQESILLQYMGASRFVYNWCLAQWKVEYAAGRKPTAYGMAKLFRANRPEWFAPLDTCIIDRSTANLGAAFRNFFAKRTTYPIFKKKDKRDSYQAKAIVVRVDGNLLTLPKCPKIKMARPLFHEGKIVGNTTISKTAGRWYASIPVETEAKPRSESQAVVGIDLGITTFATLSTGEKVENPKFYRAAERRLAIRQRSASRKVKGSNNHGKAKAVVARTHAGIRNRRNGFLHMLTADLYKRFAAVAIEDLNVSGMVKNRHLAKSISDAGFREFRRQLEYKMPVLTVGRFFPSSKTCSTCGSIIDKLPLSVREWECPSCGDTHDRDHNAAKNIVATACGEFTPASPQGDMIGASRDDQGRNEHGLVHA